MEFLKLLVYEKTFRVITFCLYIIVCGNVDNCISSRLKYRVLYNDIKVNESLRKCSKAGTLFRTKPSAGIDVHKKLLVVCL